MCQPSIVAVNDQQLKEKLTSLMTFYLCWIMNELKLNGTEDRSASFNVTFIQHRISFPKHRRKTRFLRNNFKVYLSYLKGSLTLKIEGRGSCRG